VVGHRSLVHSLGETVSVPASRQGALPITGRYPAIEISVQGHGRSRPARSMSWSATSSP